MYRFIYIPLILVIFISFYFISCDNSKETQATFFNEIYDYTVEYPASWTVDSQEPLHIRIFADGDATSIGISIHSIVKSPFDRSDRDDDWQSAFQDYVDSQVAGFRKDTSFSAIVFDQPLQHSENSAREIGLVFESPDSEDMVQSKSLYILHYPNIYQIYGATRKERYEDFVVILDRTISSFHLNEVVGGYTQVEWEQVNIQIGISGLFLRSQAYLDDSYDEIDTEEEIKAVTSGNGEYSLYDYLYKFDYPLIQSYDIRKDGADYVD